MVEYGLAHPARINACCRAVWHEMLDNVQTTRRTWRRSTPSTKRANISSSHSRPSLRTGCLPPSKSVGTITTWWSARGHAQGDDAKLDLYGLHDNGDFAPTICMAGKIKGHTFLKFTIHRFARMVQGMHCELDSVPGFL